MADNTAEIINGYEVDFAKGLRNEGNPGAIRGFLQKMQNGEPVTIAFLGGSITQGAVATDISLCYASRVHSWLAEKYPDSQITLVNAGIGATDSQFGAARVKSDVLIHEPDFVLLEYAVNDECTLKYRETFEGVVRQILGAPKKPALLIMYNCFYNNGTNAEEMHAAIADHYGIPAVGIRETIYASLQAGKFENRQITPDDLHPNDDGHELVARVITYYLETLMNGLSEDCAADPAGKDKAGTDENAGAALPAPVTADRYENAVRYDNRNDYPVLKKMVGFLQDSSKQEGYYDCFKNGYRTKEEGSYAEYEAECSCIAVQFKRTVNLPAPIARAVVDGNEETAVMLDANFEETWGDKLELTTVYESDVPAKHTVRIEVTQTHPDDRGEFYLASLIVAG